MITKLVVVETESTDVFVNQGVELALFNTVSDGELVLYLWSNDNVVVVGRNQNAYAECNVDALEADGGKLARRLSGGGAVYHDLGNLNFTFIAQSADFSLEHNRDVVLSALKSLGIMAELTGRNDVEVDGCKVSGNAYYKKDGVEFHHGTMLITSLSEKVGKYLTPPSAKFSGKAVKSVKSRVSNLASFKDGVTKESFASALKTALKNEYPSARYEEKTPFSLGAKAISDGIAFFASDEWRYGKKDEWDLRLSVTENGDRVDLALNIYGDVITDCAAYTDSMDYSSAEELRNRLIGVNLKTASGGVINKIKEAWYEI